VVLTSNEVELHESEHPYNAFAVVRHITLNRNADLPHQAPHGMPTPISCLSSVGSHLAESHGGLDFFDARLSEAGQVGQRPRDYKDNELAEF
jgi:hypothetical protein